MHSALLPKLVLIVVVKIISFYPEDEKPGSHPVLCEMLSDLFQIFSFSDKIVNLKDRELSTITVEVAELGNREEVRKYFALPLVSFSICLERLSARLHSKTATAPLPGRQRKRRQGN